MVTLQLTVLDLDETIYEDRNPIVSRKCNEFLNKTLVIKVVWVEFVLVGIVLHKLLKGICEIVLVGEIHKT